MWMVVIILILDKFLQKKENNIMGFLPNYIIYVHFLCGCSRIYLSLVK